MANWEPNSAPKAPPLPPAPARLRAPGADSAAPARSSLPLPEWADKQSWGRRAFYGHLTAYIGLILFLFVIDLAGGEGWWFFWPALGWGIAIVIHGLGLLGTNRLGPEGEERTAAGRPGVSTDAPSAVRHEPADVSRQLRQLIDQGVSDEARLRSNALRMSEPEIRAQALRICTRADDILTVLAEPGRDELLAREFVDQVLTPARTVFANYVRLSERKIASAEPALRRVETIDLPYIEQTLDDLHDRLHRNDVISLEVASEMLTLGRAISIDDETEARGR